MAGANCAGQERSAHFRLREDGWYIHATGGGVLVNQRPVAGWTRVRFPAMSCGCRKAAPISPFGSCLLGHTGPRSVAAPTPQSTAASTAIPVTQHAPSLDIHATEGEMAGAPRTAAASEIAGNGVSPGRGVRSSTRPAPAERAIVGRQLRHLAWRTAWQSAWQPCSWGDFCPPPPTIVVQVGQPTGSTVESKDGNPKKYRRRKQLCGVTCAGKLECSKGSKRARREGRVGRISRAQLENAVYLIQVEKAGRTWPFATYNRRRKRHPADNGQRGGTTGNVA